MKLFIYFRYRLFLHMNFRYYLQKFISYYKKIIRGIFMLLLQSF